jgi:hypothetical protein
MVPARSNEKPQPRPEAFENLRSQGHAQRNAPMPICRLLGSKNQALNWAERLRLR